MKNILAAVLLTALLVSCGDSPKDSGVVVGSETSSSNEVVSANDALLALGDSDKMNSFRNFYDRFHSDSLFQVERVVFPIKYMDTVLTRDSWSMHKKEMADSKIWNHQIEDLGVSVEESFLDKNGKGLMRRFSEVQGKWRLIFYNVVEVKK